MIPFGKSKISHPTLAHKFGPWNGLSALPAPITLNGITVNPTLRYGDTPATDSQWIATYGSNLSVVGSGDDPTLDTTPFFDSSMAASPGGKKWAASNTTLGDIPDDYDILFEVVAIAPSTGSEGERIADKRNATNGGWLIDQVSTGAFRLYIEESDGDNADIRTPTTSYAQRPVHLLFMVNRDEDSTNGAMAFLNSSAGTGVNPIAAQSITKAQQFCIGNIYAGGAPWNGRIIYFAQYLQEGWFAADNTTEWAAFAAERFHRLCSIFPMLSRRSSKIFTFARSAPAYLEKQESGAARLHYMGSGWPREVEVLDAGGVARKGLIIEAQATQLLLQSNTPATASWTASATIANNTADTADPNGLNTAWKLTGLGASGVADMYQALAGLTNDSINAVGIWIKRISTSGMLAIENQAGAAYGKWTVDMSALPDAWTHIKRSSSLITVVAEFVADASGNSGIAFYKDNGTGADFYGWNPQIEENADALVTSDIVSTTAATTRAADSLKFPSQHLVGNSIGSARGAFLAPSFTPGREHTLFCLSNNEAAEDHMRVFIHTDGTLRFASAKTDGDSGAITLAGSVCDNIVREWLLAWMPDKVIFAVRALNGSIVWGMDTDVDIPAVHESDGYCHVGSYASGTEPGPVIICSLKLSDKFLPSFSDRWGGFTSLV